MPLDFTFQAPLWLWTGEGAWVFVRLPKAESAEIYSEVQQVKTRAKPGGSVRVTAIVGSTRWKTSIFRDQKTATYVLPLKAAVRAKEQLQVGETIDVALVVEF